MTARKLHISAELALPLDTVTSTIIVYGGKGMGKTNAGSVLVEELTAAGLHWAVLDPMGVWWGLRHSSDGKAPGIKCLILGGAHGDIPIEPTGGAVVADLVVDENVDVVIDFSRKPNGEMWGVGEKIRFVTDYGRRLFQRQGGLVNGQRREPIFQLLDEAARFLPQMIRAGQPDLAICLSVWSQIVEEGRNIGLGVGLLTQRSARLNKDVAELADAMIAFRTIGPNSVEAVVDWLGSHIPKERIKSMTESLRSLDRGTCLVVSPGWLAVEDIVHIRERRTFDSSATPKAGHQQQRITGEAAVPDLELYSARMKETIERVKADDPKALRKTIAELEARLSGHGDEREQIDGLRDELQKTRADLMAVEEQLDLERGRTLQGSITQDRLADFRGELENRLGILAGDITRRLEALRTANEDVERGLVGSIDDTRKQIYGFLDGLQAQAAVEPVARAETFGQFGSRRTAPALRDTIDQLTVAMYGGSKQPVKVPAAGNGNLSGGAVKLVAALLAYPHGLRRAQAKILCGFAERTLTNYISELNSGGHLVKGNGMVALTNDAREALWHYAGFAPPNSTHQVMELWGPKLTGGAQKLLKLLVVHRGRPVPREHAMRDCEFAERTLTNYVSELACAGLLTRCGAGQISANKEALFL